MDSVSFTGDFIKLGQALKLAGVVGSGVEAKIVIQGGDVTVNGQTETRRGRKLTGGEKIGYMGKTFTVQKES
ncbi:MAG: RNA-binding S4 domain-containing protein [Lachnospira sp.]|nr:RNA-binding S4 domain-containing protein [Lachnospira sp.]